MVAFRRTIDSFIIGYAKQALSIFLVNLDLIMDVVSLQLQKQQSSGVHVPYRTVLMCMLVFWQVPGDMVVNAMMVAMAAHSEEQAQRIFHLTSSLRNPAPYAVLAESGHRYFLHNPPRSGKNGEPVRLSRMRFFRTLPGFRAYMAVKFRLPLEVISCLLLTSTSIMNCDQYNVDLAHGSRLITECSSIPHGLVIRSFAC